MEPSKEEKEVAIAEMLGFYKSDAFSKNYIHKNKKLFKGVWFSNGLKFHSDANWQLEAIDFIVKHNEMQYSLLMYAQSVTVQFKTLSSTSITIVKRTDGDVKAAIFDALYNVSKYLKKK